MNPTSPRQAEELLTRIAEGALDDDYYTVRPGRYSRSRGINTVASGVVLALFAMLLAVAALETRADRPTVALEHRTLVGDIQARQERLSKREAKVADLRAEVQTLREHYESTDPRDSSLRLLSGDVAVVGSGVIITAVPGEDISGSGRITDSDLQLLVNGLWYAGAEAISINEQRIGTLTAIRIGGAAITVNYKSIAPPYVIRAIGNPDELQRRFTDNPGGRYWAERQENAGVGVEVTQSGEVRIPALPRSHATPKHAHPTKREP